MEENKWKSMEENKNLKLKKKKYLSKKPINIVSTQLLRGALKTTAVLNTYQNPGKITLKVPFLVRLQAGRFTGIFSLLLTKVSDL